MTLLENFIKVTRIVEHGNINWKDMKGEKYRSSC